ncbi:MAG: ABC transporter ATP-binding protein [Clostridia bacterium]|nr:ABC transporter ATP-binding protein [Clostridia bacterium]
MRKDPAMEYKKKTVEKLSFKETCTVIGKALRVSLKTKTAFSFVISILGFGFAFLPALVSSVLKLFTDEIQTMATGGAYEMHYVLLLFGVLILLHIAQVGFNFISGYVRACDGIRTHKFLIRHIIDCTCRVRYKYIENQAEFAQKIEFANSYAGSRVAASMQNIISWLQQLVTFVSVLWLLSEVSIWAAALLLVTSIPAAILSYKQRDATYVHNVKYMMEGALVIHYMQILTRHNPFNDICHFRIFDYLKGKWREICNDYTGKKNAMTKKHVLYNSAADLLRNLVYIVVLLVAAYKIYEDPALGLGTFTLMMSLSKSFQSVTSNLLVQGGVFLTDISYMRDYFDLDKLEQEKIDKDAKPRESGEVRFENVQFTYPGCENPVLKNINVHIRDGETVAIVGENGSGKTTFVNLLCGMYTPERGSVSIGGHDIEENPTAARRTVSAVFQNFGKYDATLRHNITVSDPDRKEKDEDAELWKLCELTGFDTCVKEQPHGFDEEIGDFAKKGNDLSGGQWQKLALTRALWRNKARIMVLDEPTAALDPIAEADIYKNFAAMTGGRTTLLVSHRLGVTSIVDRILVFRDGEIVEDGSHRELLQKNGYYAELYHAQAKWYTEEMNI